MTRAPPPSPLGWSGNVLDPAARQVAVQATVDAVAVPEGTAHVTVELLDDDRAIAAARVPVTITGAGQVRVTATLSGLGGIVLWDIDHPRLYQVAATLHGDGQPEHRAVDRYGAPRPYVAGQVTFDIEGPAVLVGDNPFDFAAAGGAAAIWIRSRPGSPGTVTVRASHPGLGSAVTQVRVREAGR